MRLQLTHLLERGLKFLDICYPPWPDGRSREGAWIEIDRSSVFTPGRVCRSREGAWIEMEIMACGGISKARSLP